MEDKIKKLEQELEQLESLDINKNTWDVHYNNSFYDAYFQSISLDSSWVKKINKIIQSNLK